MENKKMQRDSKLSLLEEREVLYNDKKDLEDFAELFKDFFVKSKSINYKIDNILKNNKESNLTEDINMNVIQIERNIEEDKSELTKRINKVEENMEAEKGDRL